MKLPGRREEKPPTVRQRLDGRRREAVLLASATAALVVGAGAWRKLRASDRPAAEPSPPAASKPAEPAPPEDGPAAAQPEGGSGSPAPAEDGPAAASPEGG